VNDTGDPASAATSGPASLRTVSALRRADHRSFVWGLSAITALGAAVRFANVLWWRPTTSRPGFLGFFMAGDSVYYHWQANALAAGHWFVDPFLWMNRGVDAPSAAHPPLYPLYLSLWSRIGVDTVTGHRMASSLLGIAAVALIGLLGFRLAGRAAGLVAAGIAAVYPQLWINDGMLLSESFAVLAIVVALHTIYSAWRTPSTRNVVLMGLACGVAALARNELLLLFPIVVLPLLLRLRVLAPRDRVRLAVVGCVAGGLVVAPWALYNLARFNEPTLTSSSLGSVLSAANCDAVYYGDNIGYYDNCFDGPWPSGDLDESERDKVPRDEAIEYMRDHIERVPVVMAARIGRMWNLFKPGQTTTLDWMIEGRGRAPSWVGLFAFYALIPFSIYGFVRLARRRITILPLLASPIILTIATAITFGVTRYRAPAEVSIVVTAAVGVVALVHQVRRSGHPAQPTPSGDQEAADAAATIARS
jgi:4-amino-4-deoxy-L-arabinose transferase-like glycosyltransferase